MKKAGKIVLALLLIACAMLFTGFMAYRIVTADAKLDKSKLINYGQTITFYDDNGNKIDSSSLEANRSSVLASDLHDYTKDAFIASEDRTFYSHNGLNYKRMVKALFKNIASFSFKEGASTISQQLIKNTHLSNNKTLTRKLKEIRLTKQLEKAYTKDQILEMYLNTIYFGHSCYGLQSAARFYFGTDAEDLTLAQSATLAGLLSSPNNYSPFKNPEKCLARRDLALKNMLECGFISQSEYENATKEPLTPRKGGYGNAAGDYIDAATDELEALNFDCYSDLSGCKVYTYMNADAQHLIENKDYECDNSVIITNSENGVCAYKNTIKGAKRQPGSTIKPLLVYAPAIDTGLIHPFTKMDDSSINFGGYAPQNHDGKYHGKVTIDQSIAQSYNIPAVKTLNMLTIDKAAEYAKMLGMDLCDDDKNLSLALGGMKYGENIKTLCDAYTTFRAGGIYSPSRFIKRIEDKDGKVIFKARKNGQEVFSTGTCSLMNEMLIGTAKAGTAKKLKNISYDIAAKTGTCGNDDGNTDAYAAGYTSEHTFLVWLGDAENKKLNVTGGGQCCNILKELLGEVYKSHSPRPLDTQSGTTEIFIDREDYEKDGKIFLADPHSPKLNNLAVKCLTGNQPTQQSSRFSYPVISKPQFLVDNDQISIVLCKTYYYSYLIKCDNDVIYDGPYKQEISHSPSCGSHIYYVTPYYCDGEKKYFGQTEKSERINLSAKENILPPSITHKDWFN